jgi:hypothetical protein
VWTARALERAGYRIVEGEASAVVVIGGGAHPSWCVEGMADVRCGSLESLIEALDGIRTSSEIRR